MSQKTCATVGGFLVCVGWLAVSVARPQPHAVPADPVPQQLHQLAEALHFAEESLQRRVD